MARPHHAALALVATLLLALPALAQRNACTGLLFSTEEDFLSGIGELGVISDGDLLAYDPAGGTALCARNADLLRTFQIRVDLGLDAVQAVQFENDLLAFSTELDDPEGRFTAGDLLGTNGAVIPNAALLARFDLPVRHDLGLDALQFLGERDRVARLLVEARELGRQAFLDDPDLLANLLREFELDLLFSTEGTGFPPDGPLFLDGDLLSALSGSVARGNADLYAPLPAGVPVRGADFGLDAFTLARDRFEEFEVLFSSEIDSLEEALMFTDGDLLGDATVVVLKNLDLTLGLEPPVRDLGLDALDLPERSVEAGCGGEIRVINGMEVGTLIDPMTGYARKIGGANPPSPFPAPAPFDRPFGGWLVLHGNLTGADCARFEYRVEWQEPSGPWSPVVAPASWQTNTSPVCSLFGWGPFSSDGDGWIPVADYLASENCSPNQALQVWSTSGRDGPHRVRLSLRPLGAPGSGVSGAPLRVVLDNTPPGDLNLTLWNAACTAELSNQCEVDGPARNTQMYIKGRARDDGTASSGDEHFYAYSLSWTGGDVSGSPGIAVPDQERIYDGTDPGIGTAGTEPAGGDVPLVLFDLSAAHIAETGGDAPPKCGYTITLRASDRTILGGFNGGLNVTTVDTSGHPAPPFSRSFCYTPT